MQVGYDWVQMQVGYDWVQMQVGYDCVAGRTKRRLTHKGGRGYGEDDAALTADLARNFAHVAALHKTSPVDREQLW